MVALRKGENGIKPDPTSAEFTERLLLIFRRYG